MASLNERIKEYSSTPTGKIVVIAAPIAVLVLIVAAVALTMLGSSGTGSQQAGDGQPLKSTPTAGMAKSVAETTSTQSQESSDPPVNLDYEVYVSRDPFERPDATETQSSAPTPPAAPANNAAATPPTGQQSSILFLKNVNNENGALYASVDLGADSYVVRAGERVGSSPYQITSVSTDSATFLYGDDSLSLRVGEDVQK